MTTYSLSKELNDSDWLRNAMYVPLRKGGSANMREKQMDYLATNSTANLNFADTAIGGNRSLNPRPQFHKLADVRLPSLLVGQSTDGNPNEIESCGMGRYYYEAIDRNASRIYIQAGVPMFNSLGNFYTGFYDPAHGNMVNTGVIGGGLLDKVGKFLGFIIFWTLVPELGILNYLYGNIKQIPAEINRRPLSRFYYMKPTMALYWSTVTVIVNALAVNMKLTQGVPRKTIVKENGKQVEVKPNEFGIRADTVMDATNTLPSLLLNESGGIDIRKVASRYQRLAQAHDRIIGRIMDTTNDSEQIAEALRKFAKVGIKKDDMARTEWNTFGEYLQHYTASASGTGSKLYDELNVDKSSAPAPSPSDQNAKERAIDTSSGDGLAAARDFTSRAIEDVANFFHGVGEHLGEYWDFASAELKQGSAFISFIVDWDPSVGEGVSNRTRESAIASKMNSASREGRAALFDFANNNLGDGVIADTLEAAISGISQLATSAASAVGLSGLAALGGKAFVDIPEFWDSSSSELPGASYTMQLRSPGGHPVQILTNLYIPLAAWLALSFPRSTGPSSYSGPFVLKLWHMGRTQYQLSLVSSLQIRRGEGNLGWTEDGFPLGIDLSVTIQNLSKLLHIPITDEMGISDIINWTIFSEDTNFTDYMAILGALSLSEQWAVKERWGLKIERFRTNFDSFFSPESVLTAVFANVSNPIGSFFDLSVRAPRI